MTTGTKLNEMRGQQRRGHAGHSHGHGHGHHHHHDKTLLTSKDKSNPGARITRIGLYVNLGLTILKAIGGYALNSASLLADAGHSAGDLLSDLLTLSTISISSRAPTATFPLGFGKVETLGAVGVSGILILTGFGIGWSSLVQLITIATGVNVAEVVGELGHSHSHSHSHGAITGITDINAAWLALGSIAIKEWLFHSTLKIAHQTQSGVLEANAWHHRTDSLTSIVALVAILGGHFVQSWSWLDPLGGVLVSAMIVQAGWATGRGAFLELVDRTMEEDVREQIAGAAQKSLRSVQSEGLPEIIGVKGTKSGPGYLVQVGVAVKGDMTVMDAGKIDKIVREVVEKEVTCRSCDIDVFAFEDEQKRTYWAAIDGLGKVGEGVVEDGEEHNHDHGHEHSHEEDACEPLLDEQEQKEHQKELKEQEKQEHKESLGLHDHRRE
ncbi:mitochondrial metal transporter [Saitoella coloradoensis]